MKLLMFRYIWVVLFFCLTGCSKLFPPSIPPAPTNVVATPGDTVATVTWDMVPGVAYFAYWAPGTSLSPESCGTNPLCLAQINVTSPYVIPNLTDGTVYSVTINGRISGGPGGTGSPSLQVTPRPAGASGLWTPGNSLGNFDLLGLTYGYIYNSAGVALGNGFVATGTSGALLYTIDGINWTPITNPMPSTTFYGLANTGGTFVAVGAGGSILYSSTYTESWVSQSSGQVNDLYAIYGYAGGFFIAAGASGTLLTSDASGTIWTPRQSNTVNSIRSVTYGNGLYVAVGDAGTLLTSPDAGTWTPKTLSFSPNLNSVTYGYVVSAVTGVATPTFVAVGSGGAVFTSIDNGVTWVSQPTGTTTQLNAVTFGVLPVVVDSQFVAVGDNDTILTSPDGLSWVNQNFTSGSNLKAVIHGQLTTGQYSYSAVGAGGLNMQSM